MGAGCNVSTMMSSPTPQRGPDPPHQPAQRTLNLPTAAADQLQPTTMTSVVSRFIDRLSGSVEGNRAGMQICVGRLRLEFCGILLSPVRCLGSAGRLPSTAGVPSQRKVPILPHAVGRMTGYTITAEQRQRRHRPIDRTNCFVVGIGFVWMASQPVTAWTTGRMAVLAAAYTVKVCGTTACPPRSLHHQSGVRLLVQRHGDLP